MPSLLASSNAARLKPHGVFVKAKIEPEKWFLAEPEDVHSLDALEDPGTEFDVQRLELDWPAFAGMRISGEMSIFGKPSNLRAHVGRR